MWRPVVPDRCAEGNGALTFFLSPDARPLRVAVVEDDPVFREELICSLGAGADGYRGFDGYAANHPDTVRYDVLVLDLSMPGLDGFEAILKLAADPAPPRLVVLSGATSAVIDEAIKLAESLRLPVLAGLRKPVDPEQLIAVIRRPITVRPPVWSGPAISDQDIGRALAGNAMSLAYQLQFDLSTERPVGVEALLRFTPPGGVALPPGDVVAALTRIGECRALDDWVFTTAFGEFAKIRRRSPDLGISVNLSACSPLAADLPHRLYRMARGAGLEPESITVELPETAFLSADAATVACLARLRLHGYGLSMDDFGVGTSNLDRLMSTPFSEIKIDRSLIAKARQSSAARGMLQAVAAMGTERGAIVVAEGIENRDDMAMVRALGCHRGQGFLFAHPVPVASLGSLIAALPPARSSTGSQLPELEEAE